MLAAVGYSPNTVEVLCIVAAACFAAAVILTVLRPALEYWRILIGAGLTVFALAVMFLA